MIDKKGNIKKLRLKRDSLWKQFISLPRRDSFSGLHIAGELGRVQKRLDKLGDKTKRHYPTVSIGIG